MDGLQFTLFFVALLVGYVLLHLRLVRFEEHLQKLAGIRSVDDRLRVMDERLLQLVESLEKVRLVGVEARIDRLHEDLEDLREVTIAVRHAVVQLPLPPGAGSAAAGAAAAPVVESPAAQIASAVEGRLLQLGYGNLQILTDLTGAMSDRDVEVVVECDRAGMAAKGRVLVRNGRVRDVAIQTVAQMFP